ncbi:hypothetical protein FZC76_19435 [Sutcliffiella horikoshii]|uniref:Uncharacterized protein n=1 Tax=Sutcliffiella horikoshii TaxID=79883 RepID=A0A5D4SNJ0_9BACI|nr:hypothetical protein [Sutcliffiella horikoshii]TYS63662.1 hypothetical protein FZC76_19435 [Sutcliffiella horikoshii]
MDNYPRKGLRVRCERGVNPKVRKVCLDFCKWIRTEMEFPVRVVIYLKKSNYIKNITTKELVSATFFAPYQKDVEPYIRISTGDYEELLKERTEIDALYAYLESITHELTHYQQWLNDKDFDENEAENNAVELVDLYHNSEFGLREE